MEFNDSTVKPYDFDDLQGDTFGGDKSAGTDFFGGFFKATGYGKSGYVLVYEKRYKHPIKLLVGRDEDAPQEAPRSQLHLTVDQSSFTVNRDEDKKEDYINVEFNQISRHIPSDLFREVWEDNMNLFFEKSFKLF